MDLLGNSIGGLDLVIPHKFVFPTQENLYLRSDEWWVSTGSGYSFHGVKVIEHGHSSKSSKVQEFDTPQVSTVSRSNLMRLCFTLQLI